MDLERRFKICTVFIFYLFLSVKAYCPYSQTTYEVVSQPTYQYVSSPVPYTAPIPNLINSFKGLPAGLGALGVAIDDLLPVVIAGGGLLGAVLQDAVVPALNGLGQVSTGLALANPVSYAYAPTVVSSGCSGYAYY